MKADSKTLFFILTGICILVLLPFLGMTFFHTKGEPREAVVALSMIQYDNWILPINNGVDIPYKPPFFHWCIAIFSTLTGHVSEYTSRLPSAIALIAMILTCYRFYAPRSGKEIAFLTGLITLTNFEIHRAGINCRVDMVLTAFIVLTLFRFYQWYEHKQKGIPWLAILFMSGATLTKGPVGIILPCFVTGVFLLIKGAKFWRTVFSLMGFALLACILPSLWYIAAYQIGGDTFLSLAMEENFGRFMGKMSYASHENPWYYNVITVLAGFTPYTLLALFSLFFLPYGKLKTINFPHRWQHILTRIRQTDDVRLFSFLSFFLIFIFYCIPKSKRSVYLMPIYPFIAYFLSYYILWLIKKAPKALTVFRYTLSIISLLLLCTFAAVKIGWIPDSIFQGKHAAENIAYMNALKDLPIDFLTSILLILSFLSAIGSLTYSRLRNIYGSLAIIISLFLSLDGVYQPAVLNTKSDKTIAEEIKKIIPEGKIYSYISTDMMHFFTINFYNNDRIGEFNQPGMPATGYLLVGENDFKILEEKYGTQYKFIDIFNSHKRSCDTKDIVHLYTFETLAR